jgi:hypothetical protein
MTVHTRRWRDLLAARLCLLFGVFVVSVVLMADGFAPATAVAVTLVASAGAVEIACRLTPICAPRDRAGVVLVVIAYVIRR